MEKLFVAAAHFLSLLTQKFMYKFMSNDFKCNDFVTFNLASL